MKKIIELENVRFRYKNSENVLNNISVNIYRGEKVAIIGKSGAGKTTLLYCLNKIIVKAMGEISTGSVYINGGNINTFEVSKNVQLIATILDDFLIQRCTSTVWKELVFLMENLGFEENTIMERLREVVEFFQLEKLLDRTLSGLSGGECQKVIIASFLILKPEVICMDNIGAELDGENKKLLYSLLNLYHEKYNATVIAVENDAKYFEYYDRVLVVDEGKIIADTIPRELALREEFSNYFENTNLVVPQICWHYNIDVPDNIFLTETNMIFLKTKLKHKINTKVYEDAQQKKKKIVLDLKNVSFGYGKENVLENVNLKIHSGDFWGIIGRNGQGKTSLLKLLCGLNNLVSGSVNIMANSIGIVFQTVECQFFNVSVKEEVSQFLDNTQCLDEILSEVGLKGKEDKDPLLLTKGERKRLAIAMILAQKKEIILLDEPTSGLSFDEVQRLKEILRKLNSAGKTILLVSHDYNFIIQNCTSLVVVNNKKVTGPIDIKEFFTEYHFDLMEKESLPDIVTLSQYLGNAVLSLEEFYEKFEKL